MQCLADLRDPALDGLVELPDFVDGGRRLTEEALVKVPLRGMQKLRAGIAEAKEWEELEVAVVL